MRNTLRLFRRGFERFISSRAFEPQFNRLRKVSPALAVFRTPSDLLAHQHNKKLVSPNQKDGVLHALVEAWQETEPVRDAAEALLFLSMYPTLSRVYQTVRHMYSEECDAAAEVRLEFMRQVARWNLDKRDHVASNLSLNTRRTLLRSKEKEKKQEEAVGEATTAANRLLEDDQAKEATASQLWFLEPGDGPGYAPDDIELIRAQNWLMDKCGLGKRDADILIARYLCRLSWKAVSEHTQLSPETVRKYARRAVEMLRAIPDLQEMCPGFDDFMCVPLMEGRNSRTLH